MSIFMDPEQALQEQMKRRMNTSLFMAVNNMVGIIPPAFCRLLSNNKRTLSMTTPLATWRVIDQSFYDFAHDLQACPVWLINESDTFSCGNFEKRLLLKPREKKNGGDFETIMLAQPRANIGSVFRAIEMDDGGFLANWHRGRREKRTADFRSGLSTIDVSNVIGSFKQNGGGGRGDYFCKYLALAVMHMVMVFYDCPPSLENKKIAPAVEKIIRATGVQPLLVNLPVPQYGFYLS